MIEAVDVTVVLCTFNRAHWIGQTLRSLFTQHTAGEFTYEILVVDNASTDDTPKVIAAVTRETSLPVRCVREPRPGPSAARNRGIAEARGEWLAFLDDDELADPQWLRELLTIARQRQVRVAGGAVHLILAEARGGELSPAVARVLAPGGHRRHVCRLTPQYALNSGNQLIHRSVFDEIGGYEETWTEGGEDTELFLRMFRRGLAAWYTPRAIVKHLVPPYRLSAGYLRWLSLRQGWSLARKDHEQGGLPRTLLFAIARSARSLLTLALWCWARAGADEDAMQLRRCQLWRTQGYLRGALRSAAPGWFPQARFLAQLDFRGERQQFA